MKCRKFLRIIPLPIVASLILSSHVLAEDPGLPANLRLTLLCKALTFDRNLESRSGNEIVMAVLYQERYFASVEAKDDILQAGQETHISHVRTVPFKIVEINVDRESWKSRLDELGVDIVYLMPTRSFDIKQIVAIAQEKKLLTLTSDPVQVEDGISVGIRLADSRPKFVINLKSSKSEGVDFSSQLLGLAEVIE